MAFTYQTLTTRVQGSVFTVETCNAFTINIIAGPVVVNGVTRGTGENLVVGTERGSLHAPFDVDATAGGAEALVDRVVEWHA